MVTRKYVKGREGRVEVEDAELEITQWEGSSETDIESFATSATNGKKAAIPGNGQMTGTVQGKISAEEVVSDLLQDGDYIGLKCYITKQTQGTNKKIYVDIPEALIGSLQFGSDPNGGGGATFSFSFTSSGDYDFKHEAA